MPTYDYRCNACDHEFVDDFVNGIWVKKKCPEHSFLTIGGVWLYGGGNGSGHKKSGKGLG